MKEGSFHSCSRACLEEKPPNFESAANRTSAFPNFPAPYEPPAKEHLVVVFDPRHRHENRPGYRRQHLFTTPSYLPRRASILLTARPSNTISRHTSTRLHGLPLSIRTPYPQDSINCIDHHKDCTVLFIHTLSAIADQRPS